MGRFPFAQVDDHLVALVRRAAYIARLRNINVVRNARIIGNHVKKTATPLQRADDLRSPPFQNANHRAGRGRECVRSQPLGPHVAPHEHSVFVQGRAGRALRDGDFLEGGIVWLEKAPAFAVHPNPPWNQVRLAGLNIAVALDAGDAPGLLQFAQRALQFLLAICRQPKLAQQFGHVERDVIFAFQQPEDLVVHDLESGALTQRDHRSSSTPRTPLEKPGPCQHKFPHKPSVAGGRTCPDDASGKSCRTNSAAGSGL